MESLPGAASLVRGLLVLARAGRTGVLAVRGSGSLARIGVRAGRVEAIRVIPGDRDPLGDALRRRGDWDEAAAARAEPARPGEPLGAWAARVGATTAAAVSHALRKQLQRRLGRLLAVGVPEMRFDAGRAEVGWAPLDEPPRTAELVMGALRDRVSDEPLWRVRKRLGDGLLVLSPLGRELLEGAVLWPDEEALRRSLEAGASVDALVAAARGSPRAQRTLFAWRVIGACAPPSPRGGCATLLRKTRQLRKRARGAELLEVPQGTDAESARRALRRLARTVHPDRFDVAPPAIQAASHAVMSALVRAQDDLARG